MTNPRTPIERLRMAMMARRISYVGLERLSGVPKSAIQRYMTGTTRKIPVDRLVRIGRALDIPPRQLLD